MAIFLSILNHDKKIYDERIIALVEKTNNDLKNRIFHDMGSGVHLSYLIAEVILNQKDIPVTIGKYADFVLDNKDLLFELLDLRKFAALKAVYYIVNGLDYDQSQKSKPFILNLLSWMDITPISMRQDQYINRAEPMQTETFLSCRCTSSKGS